MSSDRERAPEPAPPGPAQSGTAQSGTVDPEPVLPVQSHKDTDAAWGEYPEPDGDARLLADRPPHWDDF